jgi:hypothetical protein
MLLYLRGNQNHKNKKFINHKSFNKLNRIDGQQVTSTLQNLKHVSSQKNQKY